MSNTQANTSVVPPNPAEMAKYTRIKFLMQKYEIDFEAAKRAEPHCKKMAFKPPTSLWQAILCVILLVVMTAALAGRFFLPSSVVEFCFNIGLAFEWIIILLSAISLLELAIIHTQMKETDTLIKRQPAPNNPKERSTYCAEILRRMEVLDMVLGSNITRLEVPKWWSPILRHISYLHIIVGVMLLLGHGNLFAGVLLGLTCGSTASSSQRAKKELRQYVAMIEAVDGAGQMKDLNQPT